MRIPFFDRMSIAGKVYSLIGACVIVAATVSVIEFRQTIDDYTEYARKADYQDRARVVQVTFRKEIQAWRTTLLRGSNKADAERFAGEFFALHWS